MRIWIINPFDELPGDTDVRHRYWSLADVLAEKGHEVTWWSSNFSHRTKQFRRPPQESGLQARLDPDEKSTGPEGPTLGATEAPFTVRLIPTSPYSRNVSLARLRNHRQFAKGFLEEARKAIRSGELPPPDRMVVSLPPLGTAEAAFALRGEFGGEVIIDIMDAWPETFLRAFPRFIPPWLREIFLSPLFRAARRAYRGTDRISAVSQIYIDLAKTRRGTRDEGQGSFHLCYHGIDLDKQRREAPSTVDRRPLTITYIGALERSYDLKTAIRAVQELNSEGHPVELHIAGAGTKEKELRELARDQNLTVSATSSPAGDQNLTVSATSSPVIHFHGLLGKDALRALLASSHAGLIPMQQDSFVGLPYKLADYCAAGLPVISSLEGECQRLLDTKKAGLFYEPGLPRTSRGSSTESLKSVILNYRQNPDKRKSHGDNARSLAEELFDRTKTYPRLAEFITARQ